MENDADFVALVRRWEAAGGVWRVLGRDRGAVTVGLYRCDDGEEVDRFVSADPRLAELLEGPQPDELRPDDRDRDRQGRARQAGPREGSGAHCRTAAPASSRYQTSRCRRW